MAMLTLLAPLRLSTPLLFHVFAFSQTPLVPRLVVPLVFSAPLPVRVPAPDIVNTCPRGMVTLSVALKLALPIVRPALKLWSLPVFRFNVPPVRDTAPVKSVTLLARRLTVPPATLQALPFSSAKSLVLAVLMVPPENSTLPPEPLIAALPRKP